MSLNAVWFLTLPVLALATDNFEAIAHNVMSRISEHDPNIKCEWRLLEPAESGTQPTIEQKARWRRDGAYAASLCTEAVNLLFAATGGGGVYLDQPIQRAFRDAQAANAHYALNWDVNGTQWGRIALGLPAEAVML